jgi:hypothetical protein
MTERLSPEQMKCVSAASEHNGTLVYYKGGFWSAPSVDMKSVCGHSIPVWSFGTTTVRSLIRKGCFEVVREEQGFKGSYPVEVKLNC